VNRRAGVLHSFAYGEPWGCIILATNNVRSSPSYDLKTLEERYAAKKGLECPSE
jgi:hypothetical protein